MIEKDTNLKAIRMRKDREDKWELIREEKKNLIQVILSDFV
jgi:hypothetical protein